jgi:cellulose synthase/poly-beta-1,6-N-acetylglucosamine synthase-like glycosyltransferase
MHRRSEIRGRDRGRATGRSATDGNPAVIEVLAWSVLIVYSVAAMVLLAYGINCFVMIHLCRRGRDRQRARDREDLAAWRATHTSDDLPIVTTQLPIYNEANVVERLLRTVCAIEYPDGKHEIQVLDDSTDHTREIAAALIAELRAEGHDIHHVCRPNREGFKAGALAAGMKIARGEHLAIFDADFVPQPEFLMQTVPYLEIEPRCAFVQTRWGHRNRNYSLLTTAQSIGIDGHFAVEQAARSWNGLFLNFNGTAGVWRKQAIVEAGGWQSDTLTEDMDLSYRAQLVGWEPRYLIDVVTPAEVPTDINALKVQQHRWAKGSIQTAIKLLPTVLRRPDVSLVKKVQAFMHMTHYVINPVMLLMALLVLPLLLLVDNWFHPVLMCALVGQAIIALTGPSSLYMFSQRMVDRGGLRTALLIPLLMFLGVGLAVNNTKAVLGAIFGGKGSFRRTPKLGDAAESGGAGDVTWYRQRMSRLFAFEIFVGLWSLAAFVQYLFLTKFLLGPLLLVNAVGYSSVGLLTLAHQWRLRRVRVE